MKIVHICHTYIDGFSYQDNELPKAHAKLGHDVTVISTLDYANCFNYNVNQNFGTNSYKIDQCKIIRLKLKFKINYRFAMYKGLYLCLQNEEPDLIYFHGIPYFNYYDIIKYKIRYKCKLVVDFHCDFHNSANNILSKYLLHKGLYHFIIALTKYFVDQYYAVTPGTIDFVHSMYGINKKKINLLPLGGDVELINLKDKKCVREQIRKELGVSERQIVIVTAGKIDVYKKTINLVKACNLLNNNVVTLLIIGSIDYCYEKELKNAINNNINIILLGWKKIEDIYRYFLASDIACFPGGQSVLWQQAICCGLPLICKYWNGGEYLDSGGNVAFLRSDSEEELYMLIKKIVDSEDLRQKMSEISKNEGSNKFSYLGIGKQVIDDISGCISS